MSDCVIVFALTLVISIVAPLSGQDCNNSSVAQCFKAFDNLKQYRTHLVLDDVLPSWNKSKVHQLCVSYDQFSVCMKTVITHCSLHDQLTHEGLNDAFQHLCKNSTITEYLAYQACFGRSDLRRSVDFCNETFSTKTKNLNANSAEKRRQYCRYYDDYVECVVVAVKPACGNDASEWQKNYVNKLHQPVLSYIGCSGTTDDTDVSAATIIISAFIILIIILMVVVIVVFVIVIRRRHSLASGRQRRRRRHPASSSTAPDYDAPYVVYSAPGPNGERQVRVVGLGDNSTPAAFADAATFKGVFVQPPPYVEEPPPAFDEMLNAVESTTENQGFDADDTEDTSATGSVTSRTATNTAY